MKINVDAAVCPIAMICYTVISLLVYALLCGKLNKRFQQDCLNSLPVFLFGQSQGIFTLIVKYIVSVSMGRRTVMMEP